MINTLFNKIKENKYFKKSFLLFFDVILISFSITISFLIIYDFKLPLSFFLQNTALFLCILLLLCTTTIFFFNIFKIYSVVWDVFGIYDLARLFFATFVSSLVYLIVVKTTLRFLDISSFIFVLYWGFSFAATFYLRLIIKVYHRWNKKRKNMSSANYVARAMIIGAGFSGQWFAEMLIKNGYANGDNCLIPVAFIDDDRKKHGKCIYGIPVVGGRDKIVDKVEKLKIDQLIFAIPSANSVAKKQILDICKQTCRKTLSLPSLEQIVKGAGLNELRSINYDDLLGRHPIELDMTCIRTNIENSVVLVTGGGGSIGSELCRIIAEFGPSKIIIFDYNENSSYELQLELKSKFESIEVMSVIGSIRDLDRLDEVFDMYKPDLVFHAAAHKHVPLMEDSPIEAVKNNIFGTLNVALCADRYKAKKFVLISTDKAVNPTNIMGATKRAAELIIKNFSTKSDTKFTSVRFGNVLGSNGSVIQIFKRQIARGGPVTVTHKDATRYFMTIKEAAELVLQAASIAEDGELYILDMGHPVKISDMANDIIRLSGYEPGVDIKIVYTGLRPGEKMHEKLLLPTESIRKTKHKKIMVTGIDKYEYENIDFELKILKEAVLNKDVQRIYLILEKIAGYKLKTGA